MEYGNEALGLVDDGGWDASTLSASDEQNLFGLGNDDSAELGAFLPAEQYLNDFTSEADGSATISLIPSDELFSDFGAVSFSLPNEANSDESIFGELDPTDQFAGLPESALELAIGGG